MPLRAFRLRLPRTVLLAALAAALLTQPAHAANLDAGSRGPQVLRLAERLAALGYLPRGTQAREYTAATRHAVVALQKWHGLARDGVVGPRTRAALARATRPVAQTAGPAGRRIEVLLDRQLALLIRDGQVRRVIAVSTGAPGFATAPGSFRVFRKEIQSWSHPYAVWLPYASYFHRGIAFHGYASVPSVPASHGCVRVPLEFMREVYAFAAKGTPVRVLASSTRPVAVGGGATGGVGAP